MRLKTYYIYIITGKPDGRKYIGQTINPSRRWNTHSKRSRRLAKFTIEFISGVKIEYAAGAKISDIAYRHKTRKSTISKIVKGEFNYEPNR